MENKNPIKIIIVALVAIGVCIAVYFTVNYFSKKDNTDVNYIKNYKINEFIPTYISDEDMAKIYLNDYVYTMFYDTEKAYNLLDENYRNKKFANYETFKNYINSLPYSSYSLLKYYKKEKQGYIIFGVYDKNNNLFIFKTNGVMQYSVYLDDYTVEI